MTKPKSKIADKEKPNLEPYPSKKKEKLPFKPGTEGVLVKTEDKRVRDPKDQEQKDRAPKNRVPQDVGKLTKAPGFRVNLLDSWMELNATVKDMAEDELAALITAERKGQCRPNILLRLHGKMNKLRGLREKSEIMQPLR
jgi:hypothetical protein